ncbi:MAG: hypothetical protein ACYCS1_09300 [Gammaproteobacteria bacterium]
MAPLSIAPSALDPKNKPSPVSVIAYAITNEADLGQSGRTK